MLHKKQNNEFLSLSRVLHCLVIDMSLSRLRHKLREWLRGGIIASQARVPGFNVHHQRETWEWGIFRIFRLKLLNEN